MVYQLREKLAEFVRNEFGPYIFLITCGLPGTWKTETSQEISKIKGYTILRTDLIRLEVLKNEDIFDVKVAGNMNKREMVLKQFFSDHKVLGKGVYLGLPESAAYTSVISMPVLSEAELNSTPQLALGYAAQPPNE